jgi:negative regulator of sigma E activity
VSDARDFLDTDVLSAYLDGECTEAERAAVEARLATSAEWRTELEEVRGARAMLRSVAERDAPDGFWESVIATVAADDLAADDTDEEEDAPAPVVSLEEKRRGPGRWIATAFAAAAAVGLAVIIVPQRDNVSPDVTAVVVQHGAQASDHGDPIGTITPVGPLGGFRR